MHQIHKAYYQKYTDTESDIHIALLQLRSTSLGPGLPNPAMLIFSHPIIGIMPISNRLLINLNNDEEYYNVLVKIQTKNDKSHDTSRNNVSFALGSPVVVQCEDGIYNHITHNDNNYLSVINYEPFVERSLCILFLCSILNDSILLFFPPLLIKQL